MVFQSPYNMMYIGWIKAQSMLKCCFTSIDVLIGKGKHDKSITSVKSSVTYRWTSYLN